jgi:hypothetical protein
VRRDVAVALKGLAACLEVMRKGVPDAVVLEAHRLESLFFDGYDPYFEGDEPPGFVERTKQSVSLVISGTGGTLGSNTLGLGIRSRPENRSPLVPLALTDSRRITGKPRNPLWGKKEVPCVPFR